MNPVNLRAPVAAPAMNPPPSAWASGNSAAPDFVQQLQLATQAKLSAPSEPPPRPASTSGEAPAPAGRARESRPEAADGRPEAAGDGSADEPSGGEHAPAAPSPASPAAPRKTVAPRAAREGTGTGTGTSATPQPTEPAGDKAAAAVLTPDDATAAIEPADATIDPAALATVTPTAQVPAALAGADAAPSLAATAGPVAGQTSLGPETDSRSAAVAAAGGPGAPPKPGPAQAPRPGLPEAAPSSRQNGQAAESSALDALSSSDESAATAAAPAPAGSPSALTSPTAPLTLSGLAPVPAGDARLGAPSPASGPVDATATVEARIGSDGFGASLGARISVLARDGIEQARLNVNPAELGPIAVRLALDGTQVRVDMAADWSATRQALEQSLPALASALRDAGFTLAGGGVFQQAPQDRGNQQGFEAQGRAAASLATNDENLAAATRSASGRATPARGLVDLFA
ncbi:MAG: flagellar hook-length control protein FliK [Rubrivivax sp.]|nr:flagellar hook-length control protein FliK [Rubrivivax sp.]